MIRFLTLLALLAALLPAQPGSDRDLQQLVDGNRNFAFALLDALGESTEDALISPTSLLMAFGMTWAGSEDAVHADIARTMRFDLPPERFQAAMALLQARLRSEETAEGASLRLANRLWGAADYRFEPGFLDLTRRIYGAEMARLDFSKPEAARRTINDWVAGRTARMIPELLPPGSLDGTTALALTNAAHFKGRWVLPFDPKATRLAPWRGPEGSPSQVHMMSRTGKFSVARTEELTLVEIPFLGEEVVMSLVLPAEDSSLAALEKHLTPARFRTLQGTTKPQRIRLQMPRFGLGASSRLHERGLPELGMKAPFASSHDWGPLNGDREALGISGVYHDAKIVVDESGAEAAAATGIVMKRWGAPATVRADRPFLFTIHHRKTGALLFLGRLVNPKAP